MELKKRNGTPHTQRNKISKIPFPKSHKKSSNQSNKFILPLIKETKDDSLRKEKKDLFPKLNRLNNNRRKSGFSIDNIDKINNKYLSPIPTDVKRKNKSGSKDKDPKKIKYKLKLKENSSISVDKNNKGKNGIKAALFHESNSSKCNPVIKLPLIDQNANQIKKEENKMGEKNKEFIVETKKYASHTRKGTNEDGVIKENNQDASIILNNVMDVENYCIYGIMDGHGSNGHLASNFVKDKIKEYFNDKKIYKKRRSRKSFSSLEASDLDRIYEKLTYNNYEIIRDFYKIVNDELYDTKFDVHFSGTTCVLIFKIGKKLICSNVGDSRAILANKKDEKSLYNETNLSNYNYEFVALSHDHKPENEGEKERIEKMGGEVSQEFLIGKEERPVGPFRVWNKGCDYPGIAISRSLGDKIAELIGVIAEPEILEFDINDRSKYILMGSDGLFDYLSNYDIISIGGSLLNKNNPDKACLAIIDRAAELFKEKEKRIDDITINIIIL